MTTDIDHEHGHGHGHGHADDMERAVAEVTAVRQEIEGYQLRLECARIASSIKGMQPFDVVPLAKEMYTFVCEG